MPKILDRLKNGWNAFINNKDPVTDPFLIGAMVSTNKPDRMHFSRNIDRTIIASIFNRMAMDVASIEIRHVKLDKDNRFAEYMDSTLDLCLSLDANLDQTGRALRQDIAMSLFDEGCVAIVPTDATKDPNDTDSYEILELRVGKVIEWYPHKVKIQVYNERKGIREEIFMLKTDVAIVENPLYAVMNEPNSTLKRLVHKMSLLDKIDEQSSAGKLDLIIQLPYVIKTESRKKQAEARRKDIEQQLSGSKYGIAYTDGTERITQLNRPIENNLQAQIKDLTSMLYSQLGLTEEIMNGSADEKVMMNYYSRSIEPVVAAITDEMERKFLTKTARTQKQSIMFFRDPFKLIPVSEIASIADTFTRNEIMTSNEIRALIGMKPSKEPSANELRNKNLNQKADNNSKGAPQEAPEVEE